MGKLTIPEQILDTARAAADVAEGDLRTSNRLHGRGIPPTSQVELHRIEGAVRAAFLAAAAHYPAPEPAPAGKLSIPLAVVEAARRAAGQAAFDYSEKARLSGSDRYPLDPNGEALSRVRTEAIIAAGMRLMAQLHPAPPAPQPAPPPLPLLPGYAERFREAVYELAGPRPKGGPLEPDWTVDLFEVERRIAHQEQPAGAEPLVQPAE